MIQQIPIAFPILHGLAFAGFLIALILGATGRGRAAGMAIAAAVTAAAANLLLIFIAARRPPVYGLFESVTAMVVVAGLVYFKHRTGPDGSPAPPAPTIAASAILSALCGVVFTGPVALNHDFFMYADPWVRSFFFFRLVSAGIILGAGIFFAANLKNAAGMVSPGNFLTRQNTLFLLGMLFFLVSEFSGSVWCLKGWGDSWRWSGNFFQSTAVFFLFMLNFHIPPGTLSRLQSRNVLGAASSFIIVFLFLY